MRIDKILNAVKNIDQVYEGVKNKMFKKSYIEDIADYRWKQCKTCPHLDIKGTKCAVPGTKPCCGKCGCSLALKLRAMSTDCPLKGDEKKWDIIMDAEQESLLLKNLDKQDEKNKS